MPKRRTVSLGKQNYARVQQAVSKYNAWVDKISRRTFDYIPNKTSLAREISSLLTPQQFRERLAFLNSVDEPGADVPVLFRGALVPAFMQDRILELEASIDDEHQSTIERLFPNWEDMTSVERATAYAKAPIAPTAKTARSGDDMDDLQSQYDSEKEENYVQNYMNEWIKYCSLPRLRNRVLDDIEWIADNYPGMIKDILNRGDKEATIEYIYQYSAFQGEDVETRHGRIVQYWRQLRQHLKDGGELKEFEFEYDED